MSEMTIGERIKNAWNAFVSRDSAKVNTYNYGLSYGNKPDRLTLNFGNERSIIASIYNRIAMDVAALDIRHVRLDDNERYVETIQSGLNNCLSNEANIDQSGREFIQDIVLSLFDEGCVGILPVDTKGDPMLSDSYDILSMRTCKIIEWYPKHVRVKAYDDRNGKKRELIVPKRIVGIIENPLYSVMNQPNSTLKRLIMKLNMLDSMDKQSSSGKLDLIIQFPYVIKGEVKKKQAEERRKQIEEQLSGSKYGIAYTDGTERITQLNRPVENQLMSQIEYLTRMLFSQLGLTEAIFDGTADEAAMINYHNRTIEPVISAIINGMSRKFLTSTARSQGQAIKFFRDPFKLVPVSQIADIADKFTRNEILTSNEVRSIVGYKPSNDPDADELRNKNLNKSNEELKENTTSSDEEKGEVLNEV